MVPIYFYDEKSNGLLVDYYFLCDSKQLINTNQLVSLLEREFRLSDSASEFFLAIYWSQTYDCKGILFVSKGVNDNSNFKYSIAIKGGILLKASSFSLVHNHPNKSLHFSLADCQTTKHFKNLGKILDMPLHEHVLIANHDYAVLKGGEFYEDNE